MVREPTSRTSTSNFGVGKREGHDARDFYARFTPPQLSDDDTVATPRDFVDPLFLGDAAAMHQLHDNEVALVVTSPPYFAGKQYEEELEREGVPSSYVEYLDMLTSVFAECKRVLEPGGRIAVNVANLGRKPFRSLAGDVTDILERLGFLLRGEIVWRKGEGANGSCAWGSYRSPTNPTLRDTTERVIVASKGRFDRAIPTAKRVERGLPHRITISADEFMNATLDVWDLAPESAKRVQHPAPFPVSLPERLIHLYTYENDLVLDPFLGSGSTLVAAARTSRRGVGYDLDPAYLAIARERLTHAFDDDGNPESFAATEAATRPIAEVAASLVRDAGFTIQGQATKLVRNGPIVSIDAIDARNQRWLFDVSGALLTVRNGLHKTDIAWRSIGRAVVMKQLAPEARVVLLSSHLPKRGSESDTALRSLGSTVCFDVVELNAADTKHRLLTYATTSPPNPLPGFWEP